jgi:hypothetical protein
MNETIFKTMFTLGPTTHGTLAYHEGRQFVYLSTFILIEI